MAGVNFWGLGSSDSTDTSGNTGTNSFGISQGGLSAGFGLAGLGLDIFGTIEGMDAAQKSADASKNIAGLDIQVNQQRQLAMQVFARRQQMETIRQGQVAASQAQASATNQGAAQGSGLQGGIAQVKAQAGVNLLGQNQQLAIGNKIFGYDYQIDEQKMALAQAQSDQATSQGWMSIGGSLLKAAPTLASLLLV